MREDFGVIKILKIRKKQVKRLAKKYNKAECTILEYLLNGKIDLKELDN